MNFDQFSTEAEANFWAAKMIEVLPQFGKPSVFIPEYGGPFATPASGDEKFFHLKWSNGHESNVGLIRNLFAIYGTWMATVVMAMEISQGK